SGESSRHRSKWRPQAASLSSTCTVGAPPSPRRSAPVGAIAYGPVCVGEAGVTWPTGVEIAVGRLLPAALVAPRCPVLLPPRRGKQRRWRQRRRESRGELAGSGERILRPGTQSHRPAGEVRQREGYAGHHLARTARLTAGNRCRWQRRVLRSWPAASQRGVKQPAESLGVLENRVVRKDSGQGSIDAQADDL